MSRFGDVFLLAQQVSMAAKEEASRYDLPEVDVDHLLLALLVSGGPAGRLLRAQGLTLDAARRATEQVRADHIARLGIVAPAAVPRPIRDPAYGDVDWTPRALKAVSTNADRHELGLLTGLLDEPSGHVAEVLAEADVDVEALRAALTKPAASEQRPTRPGAPDEDWRLVQHTGFVPAPVPAVWALVSDPTRRPEWDSTIATAEALEPGVWQLTSAANRPDGARVRMPADRVRTQHRVTAYEPEELVEWEVTFPDRRAGQPSRQRLSIRCRPAEGGTTLELTISWPRRRGWRGVRQALLHPAHRAMATLGLVHHAGAISRRLR